MIKAKHIPPEVVEAAGEGFLEADRVPSCSFDDAIRAALAAGLAAWPGVRTLPASVQHQIAMGYEIILPLPPQEASDD